MRRRRLLAALPVTMVAGCTEIITADTLDYRADPAAVNQVVVDEAGYELAEIEPIIVEEEVDLPALGERDVIITNHVASYPKTEIDDSTIDAIKEELAEDIDLDDVDPDDVDLDDVDPDDVDLDDVDLDDVDPDDLDLDDVDLDDVDPEDIDLGGLDEEEDMLGLLLVLSTPKVEVAGQGMNPVGRVPLRELVERVSDMAAEESGEDTDLEYVDTIEITVLGTDTNVEKFESSFETDDGQRIDALVYVTRVGHRDDYIVGVGVLPELLEPEESALLDMFTGIEHPV